MTSRADSQRPHLEGLRCGRPSERWPVHADAMLFTVSQIVMRISGDV